MLKDVEKYTLSRFKREGEDKSQPTDIATGPTGKIAQPRVY
jgi:hypothetical protein